MITKLFVVVSIILLLACENSSEEAVRCYGQNSIIMAKASVFGMQGAYIREKMTLVKDSAFVNDVLSLSELLESAADELIIASGGIEENTSRLLNECAKGQKAADVVREKQLILREQLDLLYNSSCYLQFNVVDQAKGHNGEKDFELKALYSNGMYLFVESSGDLADFSLNELSVLLFSHRIYEAVPTLRSFFALSSKFNLLVLLIEVFPFIVSKAAILPDNTACGQIKV